MKITDGASFVRLKTAMQLLGITEDHQSQIFQAVAAILHLGNLKFTTDPQTKTVSVVNEAPLTMAATLLGVPAGLIVKYLTKRCGTSLDDTHTHTRIHLPIQSQRAHLYTPHCNTPRSLSAARWSTRRRRRRSGSSR